MDMVVRQERAPSGTRRFIELTDGEQVSIYFEMLGEFDVPQPTLWDGFVHAVVFRAMQTGQPLRVHGPMSRQALINLSELQDFWATLCPAFYRRVEIIPDEITDAARPDHPARAICAFSGGSDATFTLMRHRSGALGNASIPIQAGLLMQHDPMIAPGDYSKLIDRTKPLLDELGVTLKVIKTNVREAIKQLFNDSHAAQISACLHNYAHEFDYAVLGSSEPYRAMLIPWGSTPATDHLLSTPLMWFAHDGAAYTRTEKIIALSKHQTAVRTIQFCWMSAHDNCGKCGKCLRTRINFLAAGVWDPPCFNGRTTLETIDTVPIPDAVCRNEMMTILAHAEAHGIKSEWVDRLRQRLSRHG